MLTIDPWKTKNGGQLKQLSGAQPFQAWLFAVDLEIGEWNFRHVSSDVRVYDLARKA
jgi:hypothetical protein